MSVRVLERGPVLPCRWLDGWERGGISLGRVRQEVERLFG